MHGAFLFHIRYQFVVSNSLGSVEGSVTLIVQDGKGEGEGEQHQELKFESNPVTQKEFGEYVASLHSCNNSMFILQYQVLLIAMCMYGAQHGYTNFCLITVPGIRRRGKRS